jgi:MFS family permease
VTVVPQTATSPDRLRLVRRSTVLLGGAQVALWGALGVFAAFGPITADDLSGRESAAILLVGVYSVTAAVAARLTGRYMDRSGRRPGLALGYLLLGLSGVAAFLATAAGTTIGLVASAGLLGAGAGAALLGRAAVADMYPPERRGRAVGKLVMVGTLGAVGVPPLAGAINAALGGTGGADPPAAPWLLVTILSAVALALVLALRPDPRALAVESEIFPAAARSPSAVLRLRPAVAAATAIGVGQAVMVTFMGVVPVVIHRHGAGELTVTLVVSLHLAGMFALSSLIGAALDRWGRRSGLLGGALLSAAGVLLSLSGITAVAAAGLFLIGVGWSAAYLGSTAVVSDLAGPAERAGALGLTDLIAASSAGVGVLGSAILLEVSGFSALVFVAVGLLALPVALLVPLRETTPGSWPVAAGSAPPAG